MEKKRCSRCETLFQPKRRTARFCCSRCASAERSKRYRARKDPSPLVAVKIECSVCRREVLVLAETNQHGKDRQYCGADCKKTAEKIAENVDLA